MDMANNKTVNVQVGDLVRFDTHSNLGICEDVVRELFVQELLLEPYARNRTEFAVVLTNYSWTPLSHILEVL